jgi:transposase
LGEFRELIDQWLFSDLEAPRKQRHTARRVWQRLVDEHGADVAETSVREHVAKRRRALGQTVGEVFVPQVHAPGRTAEVDWGQAQVSLAGTATVVHLFFMRAWFSGAGFAMASPVETQQAFLEGGVLAFDWFGGVFAEVRSDDLGSAVKKVLRGRKRVQTDRSSRRAATIFCEIAVHQSGITQSIGCINTNREDSRPSPTASAQMTGLLWRPRAVVTSVSQLLGRAFGR